MRGRRITAGAVEKSQQYLDTKKHSNIVEYWGACMMPSSIKKIWSFFKKTEMCKKIFIVFVTLGDLNKTSNRAVTHTSFKMHEG